MVAIVQIGLTVPNLAQAVEWYSKVLGFQVITSSLDTADVGGQLNSLSEKLDNAPFKRAKMANLSDDNQVGIELFEFQAPPINKETPVFSPGVFHLSVTAENPNSLAEKIVRNGGKERRQSSCFGFRCCEDPFGNVIEIQTS